MQLQEWQQFFLRMHGSHAKFMRSTREQMERRLPCMQLLCLHAHPRIPYAIVVPARRARTHAVAHHMHSDAHAGGDHRHT
jgi:hypothetical protein